MPVYLPIKPKERLYQEIVDQIQQQVLSGALKPGDQIPAERDLAERFGVSRTAVREAIKSLTEKGLIEVFVGRGTFVTNLSPDRVVESMTLLLRNEPDSVANLQEARVLVEVPTARLAAMRRTNEHLERLRTICDEIEQESSISPRLIDGDTEFHVQVARATGKGASMVNETIGSDFSARYRTQVVAECQELAAGRYPIAAASGRSVRPIRPASSTWSVAAWRSSSRRFTRPA